MTALAILLFAAPAAMPDVEDSARPAEVAVPFSASVRIRVDDNGRIQLGSGTIIENGRRRTIVLTCAHIMDLVSDQAVVEIDVFADGRKRTLPGTIIDHDIAGDVGLISISTTLKLPVALILPPSASVGEGDTVMSVGCSAGDDPTRQHVEIVAVNRYLGPANLVCSKAPEYGRSGGGLFTSGGRLIGVCSAANRDNDDGLYAGPAAIHDMLRRQQLDDLIAEKPQRKARVQVAIRSKTEVR